MRRPRRALPAAGLSITSMMDMMTIILTFLLMNFANDEAALAPSDDLVLPVAPQGDPVRPAVTVAVGSRAIRLDGVPLVTLEATGGRPSLPAAAVSGREIVALIGPLERAAEKARGFATAGDAPGIEGEVSILVDRGVPWSVVQRVVYTTTRHGFPKFRFVVRREGVAAPANEK